MTFVTHLYNEFGCKTSELDTLNFFAQPALKNHLKTNSVAVQT